MKSRLLILFALFSLTVSAEKIPQDKAREMALEFFSRSPMGRSVTRLSMINDGMSAQARSAGNAPAFYVFDNPDGKGFVVMAGDDAVMPVLGYSFDNEFPEGELPSNLQGWMDEMNRQVEFARSKGMVAPAGRSRAATGEVIVQLETAQWNQDSPYNNDCPTVGSSKAPSGCAATATAIVMRYHQWPEAGKGSIPAYTTETKKIAIAARPLGEAYEWDLMPNEYVHGKYSPEEAAQVARLMADVGSMLKMNYDEGGSGAYATDIIPGLVQYMDYDKSALLCQRYNYTATDWYNLMASELDSDRPVIYSGFNEEAGHTFVLDGYTSEMYFGVNWGWGGYCNGYFRLDAMYPDGGGIGGNNDHYNNGQNAIIGVKKNEGGEYAELMVFGEKGFIESPEEFVQNEPFNVKVDWIINGGGGPFTGLLRFALTDEDGNVKQVLKDFAVNQLPSGYGYQNYSITATITVPIEPGFRIRLYYQSEGSTEWKLVKGGENCRWELPVADEFSIEETTVLKYDRQTRKFTLTLKEGVEVSFLSSDGTALTDCMETNGNVVTITTGALPAGTYTLKLVKGIELKEVRMKLGATQ